MCVCVHGVCVSVCARVRAYVSVYIYVCVCVCVCVCSVACVYQYACVRTYVSVCDCCGCDSWVKHCNQEKPLLQTALPNKPVAQFHGNGDTAKVTAGLHSRTFESLVKTG